MIPPEVLNRKALFSLLYKIDQDLAERTRVQGCPFAGVRCIALIISESLGVDLLILPRLLKFVSVYAAADPAADAVYYRHRCGFGAAGFIGHQFFCWSAHFARDKIQRSPWSGSKDYVVYGGPLSNVGNATSKSFLSTASATGVWSDT